MVGSFPFGRLGSRPTLERGHLPLKFRTDNSHQAFKEKRRTLVSSLANVAWLEGEEIRKKGKKYIGTLPDYFGTARREAEQAAAADQQANGKDADTEETDPA